MERLMQVNPYLNFNGQCELAFKFYQQCLGGKITAMMTHAATPMEAHTSPNGMPRSCMR
jgi:PhnB protein